MEFKQALKQIRERSGLTQKQLAEALGVSVSAISMYEQGKREPNSDLLVKIAAFFQVSVDYLLGAVDESNAELSHNLLYFLGWYRKSVSDVAEALDITDEVVESWVNGDTSPSREQIDRIETVFAVEKGLLKSGVTTRVVKNVEAILDYINSVFANPDEHTKEYNEFTLCLLVFFRLNKEGRQMVNEYMRLLALDKRYLKQQIFEE